MKNSLLSGILNITSRPASTASTSDSTQSAVTIEGLESLFEDVPNLPQVTTPDVSSPAEPRSPDFLTAPSGSTEPSASADDWAQFFPEDGADAEKKN